MPAREDTTPSRYNPDGTEKTFEEFRADAREAGITGQKELASAIHEARSRKAQIADESFRAVNTWKFYPKEEVLREYYAAPNRMDLESVDTVASDYKERRVERVLSVFESEGVVEGVEVISNEEMGSFAGQYAAKENTIKLREEVVDPSSTLAHELGHAIDHAHQTAPVIGSGGEHRFGGAAEIAAQEAGLEHEPPRLPTGDDPFHMAVHEASEERRGQIDEGNTYRTQLTEKFADWYAQAVETPRFTKAVRGAAWSGLENKADQIALARLSHMREVPRLRAREAVKDAIDEVTYGVDLDWSHRDPRWDEADKLSQQALDEVDELFEAEYGEEMTQRIEKRKDDLEQFRASRPEDFARSAVTGMDEGDLYEGIESDRFIPQQTVEEFGELMGYEIGEIEVE